jgi:lycopene beta-cyclase
MSSFPPPHPQGSARLSTAVRRWSHALLAGLASPRHWLIVAWTLTMISIPIIRWVVGDDVLHWGVIAGVLLQAAAVLVVLQGAWGTRTTLRMVAIVLPLAWLVERIGSTTGVPFGAYHYTAALAPLLGGVPLVIPLAWLMMLPPAWAVASAITASTRGWHFVVVSALAFTAWDLFLDPQMVGWGYWVWQQPGSYFGIPWINFFGWFLSSALITLAVRPQQPPVPPLLVIYTITWFLQSVGQAVFWNMPGPALVGFVGMGAFVVLSIRGRMRSISALEQTKNHA